MANIGGVVAALAGGGLLGICTMLLFRVRAIEQRAEQRHRIDAAVTAIVTGVETFRRNWPPETAEPEQEAAPEVTSRPHLRLVSAQPPTKRGGRRDSLAPARRSIGPRSRELRSRRP